jgi:hypothetical protein
MQLLQVKRRRRRQLLARRGDEPVATQERLVPIICHLLSRGEGREARRVVTPSAQCSCSVTNKDKLKNKSAESQPAVGQCKNLFTSESTDALATHGDDCTSGIYTVHIPHINSCRLVLASCLPICRVVPLLILQCRREEEVRLLCGKVRAKLRTKK